MSAMTSSNPMTAQLAKEYIQGSPGPKKDTTKFKEAPLGWVMSEKFDGYRALFHYDEEGNGVFTSRSGKSFLAPEWFLESMPSHTLLGDHVLDGELWAGRDNFQLMGTVRKKVPIDEDWIQVQYQVYDITNLDASFVGRLQTLQSYVTLSRKRWVSLKKRLGYPYHNLESPIVYADQTKVTSLEQMKSYYEAVIEGGGEGIMMKHPQMLYEGGRSSYLLKYKPVYDREALIVDYKEGKGKYKGLLGAFICKPLINHDTYSTVDDDPEHVFTLSGMDDEIRSHYLESHPVNTIITFECSGYTNKGVPRFGRYLRVRDDVELRDDSESGTTDSLKKVQTIFNALENHCREQRDTFRLKSYVRANQCLQKILDDSQLLDGTLAKMEGIGDSTVSKIRLIMETGTCPQYEKIKNTVELSQMKEVFMRIHGIGPVQANKLVKAGFKTIEDLRQCPTIGDHLNDVQQLGLQYYDDIQERIPYAEIVEHEVFLKDVLKEADPSGELTIAGSYRRQKPDSGDIDLLVKGKTRKTYERFIQLLTDKGYLVCQLAKGNKKYMGVGNLASLTKYPKNRQNRRIDIMYTTAEEYPFAIFYFTGSSEYNQRVRKDILDRGLTINEYSLKDSETKTKVDHTFRTERDIYEYLGYEYVEPEDRIE